MLQETIMAEYEQIAEQGPQVRFVKCTHRPGYLTINCADEASAKWLREIVPTIKPWDNASLKVMEGDAIPKPWVCTAYVPDEGKERLEAKRILTRLRIGNRGLKTHLWTIWGKTPETKGVLWNFAIDRESRDELEKLDMNPFFGYGRLRLRVREAHGPGKQRSRSQASTATASKKMARPQGSSKAGEHANSSKATTSIVDPPESSGVSPLKRPMATETVAPMEEDTGTGGGPEGTPLQ